MDKLLIIITGGPGTGKSYMTKEIIERVSGLTRKGIQGRTAIRVI